jgi:DNA-binding LacI/PurR family transcriptional regulator
MQTTALHTRVSLRDIAQQLGLSHSTVSRALRNRPRVAKELRQKILQTAEQMGYRPDPMLSALAQYRQGKFRPEIGSAIGWINHWPVSRELRAYKEFDAYFAGASRAAEKFGYRLDEFVCNEEIPVRRVEKILRTRNVNGVLIPPHPLATDWTGFHWENYAAVRLGRSLLCPPLYQVASDQFGNTVLAFDKIREKGYRRIGFLTGRASQKGGLFKAGFLMAQSDAEDELPALTPLYLRETNVARDQECFEQWMREQRPEAILTDVAAARKMLAKAGYSVPDDIGLAVLSILDGNADAGIYQNPEEIGRVGVLLVISLINDGAQGIPPIFRHILVAGEWVDGSSLPAR